jgi:predicted permease
MTRWRILWRRRKLEEELEKELRFHLEEHTADLIAKGLDPKEARRRARIAIGGPEQVKETLRDVHGTRWLKDAAQDLRYAGRMWRKSPGFTLFALCGLALAIGANTAVFTIVKAALFRGLAVPGGDRIAFVSGVDTMRNNEEPLQSLSYGEYRDFKGRMKSFEDLAGFRYGDVVMSDKDNFPERYFAVRMTANTLSVLGQKPLLGRDLEPSDTTPGAPAVVILSSRVWENRYNKGEAVIGKTVSIDGSPATIIGVTPPGVTMRGENALWLPQITPQGQSSRENRNLLVFGRLAKGVSVKQASVEAAAVAHQLEAEYPATNKGISAEIQSVDEFYTRRQIRQVLQALWGGATFVLLIACANVANLLLGRSMIRSREMAVRAALGAGRARVIRQLLTESVLLSTAAGALGAGLSYLGVWAFEVALITMEMVRPGEVTFTVDRTVLLYLAATSIGTGIVFGLAPALRMSRVDLSGGLKEGGQGAGAGARRRILTNILVGAEVALSVVLLVGAGLMIRSMVYAGNMKLGVNTSNVLTMRLQLPLSQYQRPQQQLSFFQELIARVEALPGVESATLMSDLPGSGPGLGNTTSFQIEGSPIANLRDRPRASVLSIGPGYFRCMQAPLLDGREFTESDGDVGHEAAIVNQSFADRNWPGESPLGKRIHVDDHGTEAWSTIVGVAGDIVQNRYSERLPRVYMPYRQNPAPYIAIAARTRVAPTSLAPAFRQSARDLDPNLPVFALGSLDDFVAHSYADTRLFSAVFTVLAVIALALAATGLYAVISQSANQRVREMAIRAALGASEPLLWRLMFFRGMGQFLIGLAAGTALSFAVGGALKSQLVGVTPGDPMTYLIVVSALASVAALACGLPARRAARTDPAATLRFE